MDATSFFLTYPQSDFTHEQVYEFLGTIKPVVWCRVAIESHEDGQPHVHAVVKFACRVRTRGDMRVFDLVGRHPNVQVPRGIKAVLEYCAKGGNFRDFGHVPSFQASKAKRGDVYDKLKSYAQSGDRDGLDRYALETGTSLQWANHIWSRHIADRSTIRDPGPGVECLQLSTLSFPGGSFVLIGPSGCGKSTWAKRVAPKPALFVSHIDDLRKFNADVHKSIIFDDMDFNHWPRTAQIHLVDQHDVRSINVRYGTVTIPAGTPKIFTSNLPPFSMDPAIDRRISSFTIQSYAL